MASNNRPKFTRRHYVQVAQAIKYGREYGQSGIIAAICATFSDDNEKFDTSRFLQACGFWEEDIQREQI